MNESPRLPVFIESVNFRTEN